MDPCWKPRSPFEDDFNRHLHTPSSTWLRNSLQCVTFQKCHNNAVSSANERLTERCNSVSKTDPTKFAHRFKKTGIKFEEDWYLIIPDVLSLRTISSNSKRALSRCQLAFGFQPRATLDFRIRIRDNNEITDFVKEVRARKLDKISYEGQMKTRPKFVSPLQRGAWRSELVLYWWWSIASKEEVGYEDGILARLSKISLCIKLEDRSHPGNVSPQFSRFPSTR